MRLFVLAMAGIMAMTSKLCAILANASVLVFHLAFTCILMLKKLKMVLLKVQTL